jgi:hypothetical protein
LLRSLGVVLAVVHAFGCAPAREATHPPAAREPSTSAELAYSEAETQAHDEGGVAWTPYDLGMPCAWPPGEPELLSPAHPLVVLTNEADYVRHACKASDIDWSRFRLVVMTVRVTRERLLLEGVTRHGPDLVVALRYTGFCEPYSFAYIVEFIAVLVPAGNEHVRTVRLDGPGSC